jgi:Fic family protein
VEATTFASSARGVARKTLEGYVAFFPAPLPRAIDYSRATVHALDDATAALHRLAGVGRLLPNPTLLMGPHIRLEAVLSSRIEGTRSGVPDLLQFEIGDGAAGENRDDAREVANYITALNHGLRRVGDGFPLSLRLLREVHAELMAGVRGEHATPGEFRRTQNWIGGSTLQNAVFVPPPRDEMRQALGDWEQFLHDETLPLLVHLALAHYQFEAIHPFLDGNGRVGRLLIPLVLSARRVLPAPLLYLSVYFERHRQRYYDLLLHTSQRGDFDPWLQFFLEAVRVQARDAEERTVRLVELQARLREALLGERRSHTVIRLGEKLFDSPFVTARWVERALEVTNPTALAAIQTLVDRGTLMERTGRKRSRLFFAPEIYEAVYSDVPGAEAASSD